MTRPERHAPSVPRRTTLYAAVANMHKPLPLLTLPHGSPWRKREHTFLRKCNAQAGKSTSLQTPSSLWQAPLLLSRSFHGWVTAFSFINWPCLLTSGKEDQLVPFPPGVSFPTSHLAPLCTNTGTICIITACVGISGLLPGDPPPPPSSLAVDSVGHL